jgi:hypothetical protein
MARESAIWLRRQPHGIGPMCVPFVGQETARYCRMLCSAKEGRE